jgi:hypothetical protein
LRIVSGREFKLPGTAFHKNISLTKEKPRWGIKLPSKQRVTIAAHYERILGTNVESAGGSIGLIFGQIQRIGVVSCFETATYETRKIIKNGVIFEWSLNNHSMAVNLGFVPILGKTDCLLGFVGYAIKASYLMTKNELQRTKNHDNYWGVRIEGKAFWINPYLAAYTNFGDDFDSFVVLGMGLRF